MNNTALNLQCTSMDYGRQGLSPCLGHHYFTGYSSNLRPAVYYKPSLDQFDNPKLGVSLLESFQSQTKRHYQQLTLPSGAEPLPSTKDRSRESGYLQLYTHQNPAIVTCQTEYKDSYVPPRPRVSVCRKHHVVGAKDQSGFNEEGSGFIHNTPTPKSLSVTPCDPQQFLSQYKSKFCNAAASGRPKTVWNRGTFKYRDSGYSGRDTDSVFTVDIVLEGEPPAHFQLSSMFSSRNRMYIVASIFLSVLLVGQFLLKRSTLIS